MPIYQMLSLFQTMAVKYENEIRVMFISVFKDDHFLHNVDPDDAIAMTLAQLDWSYDSMAIDLETGLSNGLPISYQLETLGVAIGVYITI